MTDDSIETYYDPLTDSDREQLAERAERYRDQLADQGFEVAVAEDDRGFFGGVLVIDDETGRFGFLDADGSVNWLSGDVGGIGALSSAVVQNPSEALEQEVADLENADVE